jgi:hypothetical protein
MVIDIPMDAKPAPATLIWSIVGSPEYYQEGSRYLPVTEQRESSPDQTRREGSPRLAAIGCAIEHRAIEFSGR